MAARHVPASRRRPDLRLLLSETRRKPDWNTVENAAPISYFEVKGMQTMRKFLTVISVVFAVAAAQEAGPGRPGATGMPPAGQAMRGIEKKDIRAIIVYPEGIYGPGDVQRFEAGVAGLVDAIASGAKLTKADAARDANPAGANEELTQSILRQFTPQRRVALVGMTASPASAGNRPIQCPPQGCGCKENGGGGPSCSCSLYREFCYCLLCYEKTILTTFPEEDPVLDPIKLKGRMQAPGGGRPDGVLIVTVLPPDASREMPARLVNTAMEILKSEPWPAGITIKTKSSSVRNN